MGTPDFIIATYRDDKAGWQDEPVRPATFKAATDLADAIASDTEAGPIVVTVRHASTKITLYVAAGGRLEDIFPRSNPT